MPAEAKQSHPPRRWSGLIVALALAVAAALAAWQLAGVSGVEGRVAAGTTAAGAPDAPLAVSAEAFAPDATLESDAALAPGEAGPRGDAAGDAAPDASLVAAEPVPAAIARGPLPFRTQRDGSQWAGSNCGPAALAMVLAAWDIDQTNDMLRYYSHTYQGTWGRRGGTALEHLAHVAEDFNIRTTGLYDGDEFHRWSVGELRDQVAQGHPVIVLAKYRLLPGHEASPVRYDHYVVLWDVTPNGFVYNDPIYPDADEGFARFLTDAQLTAAMASTMEPRQAVAFLGPA